MIYASHYMEEVEEVCDRVAVIDAGRALARGTIPELLAPLDSTLRLHVAPPPPVAGKTTNDPCRLLPDRFAGLFECERSGGDTIVFALRRSKLTDGHTLSGVLAPTLDRLRDLGARLVAVHTDEPNLERLFLELTGNTLRD